MTEYENGNTFGKYVYYIYKINQNVNKSDTSAKG